MSLERKDLRIYLDQEVHRMVTRLADVRGVDPARLVERVLEKHVRAEFDAAIALLDGFDVQGSARFGAVSAGFDRSAPEDSGFDRSAPAQAGKRGR